MTMVYFVFDQICDGSISWLSFHEMNASLSTCNAFKFNCGFLDDMSTFLWWQHKQLTTNMTDFGSVDDNVTVCTQTDWRD